MSIESLARDAIETINKIHRIDDLTPVQSGTRLFEKLDSLGVLDLLLELEEQLHRHYGIYIQLADEDTMDPAKSPFREFECLCRYLEQKVSDAAS